MTEPHIVGMFLFDGFEPLDAFGPIQVLGVLPQFSVMLLGPTEDPVESSTGQRVLVDRTWDTAERVDIVMVPGGAELAGFFEYEWHSDPSWDPFAARAGLVE